MNKNPTFSISINWLKAMSKKKRLKKYLNWWYNTSGKNDFKVYLLLLIMLGYLIVSG